MMTWFNTDPRLGHNKRGQIVIVDKRTYAMARGSVDCKEGWHVFTNFDNYRTINADDNWPEDFVWTYMPGEHNTGECILDEYKKKD